MCVIETLKLNQMGDPYRVMYRLAIKYYQESTSHTVIMDPGIIEYC